MTDRQLPAGGAPQPVTPSAVDDTLELPATAPHPSVGPPPAGADPTASTDAPPPAEPGGKSRRRVWIEFPVLIISALLIAVFIKTFLFQAFWIPSSSMEDTLEVYDRVLVNKLSYRFGDIERGDVVVFDDPNGDPADESVAESILRNLRESVGLSTPKSEFIKRVIGVSGDTVEVRDGALLVNGETVDEPYLHPRSDMADFGPETVPEGQIFVMGDNRNASQDSRVFGPVAEDAVVGRGVRDHLADRPLGRSLSRPDGAVQSLASSTPAGFRRSGRVTPAWYNILSGADGVTSRRPFPRSHPWARKTSNATRPMSSFGSTRSTATSSRCSGTSSRPSVASTSPTVST